MQPWSLVVPAKLLSRAKTRLAPLTARSGDDAPARHRELVLAMLGDTVAAALASPAVAGVLVVTDDPGVGDLVRALGARTTPDVPDRGLNAALAHGAATARAAGARAVAAMSSDLPALRAEELTAALAAVVGGRGFVADADGTGTTLLCAATGELDPRFGPGSAAAHAAGGAVPLAGDWPGLRRDVDTAADLDAAGGLGVGPRTARLLAATPWSPG
ncbi:2-phospho-L-lactate guanylyltransferase [Modestobacter sp. L9-4]|uniref:2-phospho-L-lactate guanylyltransferase n=1 Tax=Modestobacter sp. L9-4 TaxID=2851567 RepID=UPI001C776D51|nr:2-phospho-L-lactate guanylyltransferase [Modestobacter sp. L9-4]QXG76940.1 2-phospho-L-lactate guanylyltransferase [Modestobacter sp. L9-4]